MESKDVHYADIIANKEGDIIQVDHIGDRGEIYYIIILFSNGSCTRVTGVRSLAYDNIKYCQPATPEQKSLLKKYILAHPVK